MAKKLRVRIPITIDGISPLVGEDEKTVYSETVVELASRKDFEDMNAKQPNNLKYKFEEFDQAEAETSDNSKLAKANAEIEELKKKLAASKKEETKK